MHANAADSVLPESIPRVEERRISSHRWITAGGRGRKFKEDTGRQLRRRILSELGDSAAKFSNKFASVTGWARDIAADSRLSPPSETAMDGCISWQPPSSNIVTEPPASI